MTPPPAIEVRAEPADGPVARRLLDDVVRELEGLYGPIADGRTPTALPAEMSPPGGGFVVLYEDDRPVGGGGVKRFDDGIAEIKRMYVVPDARSRGHARRLLGALEDTARGLGYPMARLDTGPLQQHARRLYESTGYREIGNYNRNELAAWWGEKSL